MRGFNIKGGIKHKARAIPLKMVLYTEHHLEMAFFEAMAFVYFS